MAFKVEKLSVIAAMVLVGAALVTYFFRGTPADFASPFALIGAIIVLIPLMRRTLGPPAGTLAAGNDTEILGMPGSIEDKHDSTSGIDLSVLAREHRRKQWTKAETVVNSILDRCIELAGSGIDAQTIAVLFPTNDGGYKIRRYRSRSEHINEDAVIYPGVGVIGSFLKDGLKQLKLEEILTDSMTLHYYRHDAGVRSLMASPIVVEGVERGAFIADSTEKAHFRDEDHEHLKVVAELCGTAVYYTYRSTEHKLALDRLSAMSSTEKHFLQEHDIEAVLDKLAEIIPFAFKCNRMTISLRNPDGKTGTIKRAWGVEADTLRGTDFPLGTRSLAAVVYDKNIALFRDFAEDRYEIRYGEDEPHSRELTSFLAFPIGMGKCIGAILLESQRPKAFSERSRDLLSRLVTSAGIAIEKIQVLHQTKALATHDGLTGLNNHRRFQQLLREAITRSGRYQEPLALVIADIDYFKKVNDTYGHRFGDTVLKIVAAKLQSGIREGIDSAARYGGEEFALVLEKMDAQSAVETVDRIRLQVSEMLFQTPQGKEITITMSFGIAIYMQHGRHQETLIQNADKALYRAKENGRNRVELYFNPGAKIKGAPA
ncbi:MAG: diguanylate cyclase [Chitinivibrionales bacterium]|nr:diguanylate cyclase [Chitinivibrionales bacterium]MBD3357429.1 diguanylate cyclase [Chitinivibrionales bacterium]